MFLRDFFEIKPRKKSAIAKKLGISRQAVSISVGKCQRASSKLLYCFMLNAKDEYIDFLLNDENFNKDESIKWD